MTVQPTTPECDLLAAVPTPAGVTAGQWRTDPQGHLVRDLSDGRIQRGNGAIISECSSCTVPVPADTAICAFCTSYVPPETIGQQLDVLVNKVDLIRADGNDILQALPADAPLFAVTDLVVALNHLKRAAVAIDKASDALEADAAAVTR